jgi:hypothetical protein
LPPAPLAARALQLPPLPPLPSLPPLLPLAEAAVAAEDAAAAAARAAPAATAGAALSRRAADLVLPWSQPAARLRPKLEPPSRCCASFAASPPLGKNK